MGGKKSIIAMFLVVILAGGAGLGYSWHRESVNARTFSGSGYVLNPNTETETKRTLFGGHSLEEGSFGHGRFRRCTGFAHRSGRKELRSL